MGNTINNRSLTAKKMLALPSPVVLCVNRADFEKAIMDAKFHRVSLNLFLAKVLYGKPTKEVEFSITDITISLLPKGEAIYLTDYEILFDPRYKLDVIKLFCEISRHNRLIVKWCGTVDSDNLIFAKLGYYDYKKYNVSDYDIACVI